MILVQVHFGAVLPPPPQGLPELVGLLPLLDGLRLCVGGHQGGDAGGDLLLAVGGALEVFF